MVDSSRSGFARSGSRAGPCAIQRSVPAPAPELVSIPAAVWSSQPRMASTTSLPTSRAALRRAADAKPWLGRGLIVNVFAFRPGEAGRPERPSRRDGPRVQPTCSANRFTGASGPASSGVCNRGGSTEARVASASALASAAAFTATAPPPSHVVVQPGLGTACGWPAVDGSLLGLMPPPLPSDEHVAGVRRSSAILPATSPTALRAAQAGPLVTVNELLVSALLPPPQIDSALIAASAGTTPPGQARQSLTAFVAVDARAGKMRPTASATARGKPGSLSLQSGSPASS